MNFIPTAYSVQAVIILAHHQTDVLAITSGLVVSLWDIATKRVLSSVTWTKFVSARA